MKRTTQMAVMVTALFLLGLGVADAQTPIGTEFTYQGRLKDEGHAANGSYNMKFELYGSEVGGSQIGILQAPNVMVTDGLFTVELDYGPGVFDNSRRWLQITVESTTLTPRQSITGAPYSIETRGLDVVEDGGGMRVGIGKANFQKFNVFVDSNEPYTGMSVERPAGENPTYNYKSGNNESVRHYLDYDSQTWRLYNAGDRIVVNPFGFVGINRDYAIQASETFGLYRDTDDPDDANPNLWGGMFIDTNTEGRPYYGYAVDGTNIGYTYMDGATDKWHLVNNGNRITVLNNGNVGLGVTNPTTNLEIAGAAKKPGGGPWSEASDRRLKKNINDLDGSLEKLMKLRGVNFEYLDPKSINELDGIRTGFVAQEVEKVFPDWVDVGESGYKALTPRGFPALAVEALRELRDEKNAQIETLECKNEELRNENEELRDRMDMLELQVQQIVESMQPQQR